MNRPVRVVVGIGRFGAIGHFELVKRVHAREYVLVSIELHVHTVLVEQVFQSELASVLCLVVHVHSPVQFHCAHTLVIGHVGRVRVVQGAVSHHHNPRTLRSVGVGSFQVFLQEPVLPFNLFPAKVGVEVVLGGKEQEMNRTNVDAPKVIVDTRQQTVAFVVRSVPVADHGEPSIVVAEVVVLLVIARTRHVRHVGGNLFYVAHKVVSLLTISLQSMKGLLFPTT